ncbi:MAG: D-tyrosyl-tRNA(Tyr) deacylase [Armatimonadetes bacterium]|nr:D-tyrosyl-tRNA(Tyr) deacylase [Armatimonadota bacterium]
MRAVVQRVRSARVTVDDEVTGEIGAGLVVFAAVGAADAEADLAQMAEKIAGLRIFNDADGKFNLSLREVGGSILAVSQFTLFGDARRGRRPSFIEAAPPDQARALFERFVELLRGTGLPVETGRFQAAMQVDVCNDGPVTILLDTERRF